MQTKARISPSRPTFDTTSKQHLTRTLQALVRMAPGLRSDNLSNKVTPQVNRSTPPTYFINRSACACPACLDLTAI